MNYCAYLIGDREVAKEIVQESFLRLIGKTKESEGPESPKDWLFICARNLCFKHLRSRRVHSSYQPLPDSSHDETSSEDRHFIEQVLGRIEAEERDLILLREVEQYSICELARLTRVSEEAVRVRLHRIRKKMQELGRK